jgi:hypothetical protein
VVRDIEQSVGIRRDNKLITKAGNRASIVLTERGKHRPLRWDDHEWTVLG